MQLTRLRPPDAVLGRHRAAVARDALHHGVIDGEVVCRRADHLDVDVAVGEVPEHADVLDRRPAADDAAQLVRARRE